MTTPRAEYDLIETMRFDPHEGIVELERHLERMKASAAKLSFQFDRHAARNELQAATFGHRERAMVRLLLSRSGAMAIQFKPFDEPAEVPVVVEVLPHPIDDGEDLRLSHKTTDRTFFDDARVKSGRYEVIFRNRNGRITEGSRSTIFVRRGDQFVTPPLCLGIMPSIFRQVMIDSGRAIEADIDERDLDNGFFIANSLRGLIPARLA